MAKAHAIADTLDGLVEDLRDVADAFRQDARSTIFAERRIADAERIAAEVRAAVRGRG